MMTRILGKRFFRTKNIYSLQLRNTRDYLGSLMVNKYSNSSEIIRTFEDDDLERILEIYEDGFGNQTNTQIIKYSKQFRNIFYVYEINGVIAGYLGFYVHLKRKGPNIIQIATAFSGAVSENMQGKGIFTTLYNESLSELKNNGVQAVYGYVNTKNERSLAIHYRLGFEIVDFIKHYYKTDDAFKIELKLHDN